MAMQASAYGRIGREPTSGTTQAGKTWANCSIAVSIDQDTEAAPYWLSVAAFGKVAEEMLRHGKGDLVSVSGQVRVSRWNDKQTGQPREQLQIVADTLISAKTVRPNNGASKRREKDHPDPSASTSPELEDELPWE